MKKRQIKIKETRKVAFNRGCEEEGLTSELARVRKMAQFSKNNRAWDKGDR